MNIPLRAQACLQRATQDTHPIARPSPCAPLLADKPDTAWVGDITYIPHRRGWLYCAVCERPLHRQDRQLRLLQTASTQISLSPPLANPGATASARPHLPLRPRRQYPTTTLAVSVSPALGIRQSMTHRASTERRGRKLQLPQVRGASICYISPQGHMPWRTSSLISRPLQPSAPAFL